MAGGANTVAPSRTASSKKRRTDRRGALSARQALHLLHRLALLVAAIWYFVVCMSATLSTLNLLHDTDLPSVVSAPEKQHLLAGYIGTTTIRQSPLVTVALQGDTSPRNGTLYLESSGPSLKICSNIMAVQHDIYTDTFLRSMYDAIVRDTAYNLTFIGEYTELIMPVVDCLSTAIILGYLPLGRFSFLVRQKHVPDNVAILSVHLSNQEYRIVEQNERGAAGIATLSYVTDLQASSVEHHFLASIGYPYSEFNFRVCTFLGITNTGMWSLKMIPDPGRGDIPKFVTTAFRSGFFKKSESEQINVNNQVPNLARKPVEAITEWSGVTKYVLHDSWGWVHGIQFILGIEALLSLVVLLIVTARNVQAGKLWIGDAFVSISANSLLRGVVILCSWYLNGFWSMYEFCVRDAYILLGLAITNYPNIMRADLLGLYLSLCGIIGVILRERIDPLVAIFSFLLGYELRDKLIHAFPSTAATLGEFGYRTFVDGVPPREPGQELISPMGYWSSHELHNLTPAIVMQVMSPILFTLVLVVAYIIYCKVYRFFYPDKIHIVRNTTGTNGGGSSGGEEMSLLQKRVLTLFEIATGAELESRFGLMSSYENYLFIKGLKFASADGIYSNGFVIANGKYVLQTSDYWSIVLITVLRWQFTRVYVYEIAGSTVQQTAKLVYPSTFTFADLVNLNISVLS